MPDAPRLAPFGSADFRAANAEAFGTPAFTHAQASEATEYAREKALQADAEKWLEGVGYVRLTAANCCKGGDVRGWFGHLAQPKGNPFLPDLLIWSPSMEHCLCVELKVREDYAPGQRQMIARGAWIKCTTMGEFCGVVKQWESQQGVRS